MDFAQLLYIKFYEWLNDQNGWIFYYVMYVWKKGFYICYFSLFFCHNSQIWLFPEPWLYNNMYPLANKVLIGYCNASIIPSVHTYYFLVSNHSKFNILQLGKYLVLTKTKTLLFFWGHKSMARIIFGLAEFFVDTLKIPVNSLESVSFIGILLSHILTKF